MDVVAATQMNSVVYVYYLQHCYAPVAIENKSVINLHYKVTRSVIMFTLFINPNL